MSLQPGVRLGPYEVLASIGAGGQGEVYRARDQRLARDVAVKVLPEHLAESPEALSRFEQEAKSVAALAHPNILAVYDFGREGRTTYVVTELLEGQTLRSRLGEGPLPAAKATEVALQITDGLSAAHAKGFVHRDLKPENLFLTKDGRVKILDFGLVKLLRPSGGLEEPLDSSPTAARETEPGRVLGTAGYMSPEQVKGREADARSDIFSLGAVLYEMVSGERAFRGESAVETMSAILREDPPELARSRRPVPPAMERLLRRCLEKDPEERFQSARDVRFALEAISDVKREGREARAPAADDDTTPSIAVLPFTDMSPQKDQEYFCEGMAEEIINALTRVEGLRVAARTSTFQFKGKAQDLRQVAEALNVRTVLEGSVRTAGTKLRVTAQLIHAADLKGIWSDRFDGDMEDVFAIQDKIASSLVEALKVRLLGDRASEPHKRYTEDIEAYHLYLKGRHHRYTTYNLMEALHYCEQAVERDPDYALAHVGVAASAMVFGNYGFYPPQVASAKATTAISRALAIDERLAEAHAILGYTRFFCEWDWRGAERAFERALALDPGGGETHGYYSIMLSALGRGEESRNETRRALELDPLSPWTHAAAGLTHILLGAFEEARLECQKALDIRPDSLIGLWSLGFALSWLGKHEEAIRVLEEATKIGKNAVYLMCVLGWAYGLAGKTERAQELLRNLEERASDEYVSSAWLAFIFNALGREGEFLDCLERAFDEHANSLVFLKTPFYAGQFSSHPRFLELGRRVGLP